MDLALRFDDLELRPLAILRCIFTLYSPCAFQLFCLIKGPNAIVQTLKPYFSVSACILPIVKGRVSLGSFHKWIALFSIPLTSCIYGKGSNPVYQPHLGSSRLSFAYFFSRPQIPADIFGLHAGTPHLRGSCWRNHLITGPTPPVAAIPSSELFFRLAPTVIWGLPVEVIKTAPVLGVGPNA